MSMDAFVFPIPNYDKVYYLFTVWDYLPLSGILFFLKSVLNYSQSTLTKLLLLDCVSVLNGY